MEFFRNAERGWDRIPDVEKTLVACAVGLIVSTLLTSSEPPYESPSVIVFMCAFVFFSLLAEIERLENRPPEPNRQGPDIV